MAKRKSCDASKKSVTASHFCLYSGLIAYLISVVVTIVITAFLFAKEYYDYAVQSLTILATLTGGITGIIYGFYANKAKAENSEKLKSNRYNQRLDMAKEVYRDYRDKKIDDKSVEMVQRLISDNDTTNAFDVDGSGVTALTPTINIKESDGLG